MNYSAFGSIVVRTPLHPLNIVLSTLDKVNFEETKNELIRFFEEDLNQEALFIASPVLYNSFKEYKKGNVKDPERVHAIMESIFKYMIRMTTRATPFGLFAGCNLGKIGKENSLVISTDLCDAKRTRLDMNYVCALVKEVSLKPNIRKTLLFYPNTSLYKIGEKLRYIERKFQGSQVSYHISQVDENEFIAKVIEHSKTGKNIYSLTNLLVDDDISYEEAESFIFDLIENQLIVDELEPSVCGDEFYDNFIKVLTQLDNTIIIELNGKDWNLGDFIKTLLRIKKLLGVIDENRANSSTSYETIIDLLKEFGVVFETNHLFQTDLIKKSHNCVLSTELLSDVKQCLKVINKLSPRYINTRIESFTKAFVERYEDNEIPLMQALDTEFGIGYSNIVNDQKELVLNPVETLLNDKLLKSIECHSTEVKLETEDLDNLTEDWIDIPDTLSCMIQLLKKDEKLSLLLLRSGGPSAANLLGRFCHADNNIWNIVKDIVEKEDELKAEEVIYAEINHITESRAGNILLRPVLRDYEIPFLAKSNLAEDFQLTLSDLMLSVRKDKLVLRSKKTNKIVIPRLTNAHNINFGSTQPIYQFLGDFQDFHGAENIFFSWGKLENIFSFFPRVTYKGHILSRAKWLFRKNKFEEITRSTPEKSLGNIELWRKENKVPEKILLLEGENDLLIDFRNTVSVSIFLAAIKNRNSFVLEEFLFSEFSSPVFDESNNNYSNQILLFFYRNKPEIVKNYFFKNLINFPQRLDEIKKDFLPGDEWIYFKIYCGAKVANDLIINLVEPIARELKFEGLIQCCFFIRYADPDFHIRVRFKAKDIADVGNIISRFYKNAAYMYNNKQIRKLAIDTYARELTRYGSDAINISEDLFSLNSDFVFTLLKFVDNFLLYKLAAIRYIDRLLSAFEINIYEKKQFFENLSGRFGLEFNKDITLKKKLGNQFRDEREQIKEILSYDKYDREDYSFVADMVKLSIDHSKSCVNKLLSKKTDLEVGIFDLLESYIHMFLNRLLEERQRYNEMVLYHMLWHHYRAEIARNKENQS